MFSDTLLLAERAHLLRLLLWGGASVLAGTGVLGLLAVRRVRSALLMHFGVQMVAWGAIEVALAGIAWPRLALRDFAGATRLDRLLWLNAGLDVGYIGVGATLAIAGWVLGRRLGAVGAGIAVVVQGAALLVLDLAFIAFTSRGI